ncbi:S-adenosyl-L-methionine-dependent methyltransferase [Thamnocephalis sphaerospora]|uniref:S-adenosyl-L-methionine-dependent methyltransferase n=1 Tax=Thamnocephalis sphaerospora TaxID=78915 RepID=A0A4P9XU87_9FUNG|nr:S-adenosyl-L-methionine-dependent methyltransferase [Thamnocephalis sphaerospora]|eukprot:RKP09000.1 S-adenosyl-L-methionine-dependent methyltransferase [Thamnocephalis sphaerospora]
MSDSHAPAFRRAVARQAATLFADVLSLDVDTSAVLELGFGAGQLTQQLLPKVRQLVAVDRSRRAVERLQQRADDQGLTSDELLVALRAVPVSETADGADDAVHSPEQIVNDVDVDLTLIQALPCCDAAVSALVYHHLAAPVAATRWQMQHLQPGGYVAMVDIWRDATTEHLAAAVPEATRARSCWHKACTPAEAVAWFTAAGLEQVSWRPAFSVPVPSLEHQPRSLPESDAGDCMRVRCFLVTGRVARAF